MKRCNAFSLRQTPPPYVCSQASGSQRGNGCKSCRGILLPLPEFEHSLATSPAMRQPQPASVQTDARTPKDDCRIENCQPLAGRQSSAHLRNTVVAPAHLSCCSFHGQLQLVKVTQPPSHTTHVYRTCSINCVVIPNLLNPKPHEHNTVGEQAFHV